MTIDQLRTRLATIQWPIVLRIGDKKIRVNWRDELMLPSEDNDICVYEGGAFEVVDARRINALNQMKANRGRT
jgi:hypothetical protein